MPRKGIVSFLCSMLLLPGLLFSDSTIISETNFSSVIGAGARALGMGGAFIAVADDGTAASWNPAGLAQLERISFSMVSRFNFINDLTPARSGTDEQFFMGTECRKSDSFGFDFISAAVPVRLWGLKIVPQVSYQRAVRFALDSHQEGIPAKFSMMQPQENESYIFEGELNQEDHFSGGFDILSFSVGTRALPWLSLGLACNFWFNGYQGEQKKGADGVFYSQSDSETETATSHEFIESRSFDIGGVNFHFGALVEIMENLKLGFVYKTAFNADIDYWNKSQNLEDSSEIGVPDVREASGSSTLKWPESLGIGLSYRPIDALTISLDYTRTNWSEGRLLDYNYDGRRQDVYYPTLSALSGDEKTAGSQVDTKQLRLGLEYVVFGEKVLIPLRMGVFTDSQYFTDASGRTVTMMGFTAGMGLKYGRISLDAAVVYENGSYLSDRGSYGLKRYSEVRVYLSAIFNL